MRLNGMEIEAIKAAARDAFGESAIVRLFGSRLNDQLRGGDIDLHIEVKELADEGRAKARFDQTLFRKIDEQRVDVLISIGDRPRTPIERIAYRDGVVL